MIDQNALGRCVRIDVQHPCSFGVYFGMGLIVAPIILGALLFGVFMLLLASGTVLNTLADSLLPSPTRPTPRQEIKQPADASKQRPARIEIQEPVPDDPQTFAPRPAKPTKPKNIPWPEILLGVGVLVVGGGGGAYAYYVIRKDRRRSRRM